MKDSVPSKFCRHAIALVRTRNRFALLNVCHEFLTNRPFNFLSNHHYSLCKSKVYVGMTISSKFKICVL